MKSYNCVPPPQYTDLEVVEELAYDLGQVHMVGALLGCKGWVFMAVVVNGGDDDADQRYDYTPTCTRT